MRRAVAASILSVLLVAGCAVNSASPPASGSPAPSAMASGTASESTGPAPPSATHPSPQPSASALAWHKLGTIGATIRDVVGFAGGYVALGDDLRVWISRDGRDWTAATLPFLPGTDPSARLLEGGANAIASSGSNLLVVGWQEHGPCTARPSGGDTTGGFSCPHEPIAWTSSDGWYWSVSTETGTGADPGEFVSAWGVPSGGWDASLGYWEGADLRVEGIWHSPDGTSWWRLTEAADERIGRADAVGAASTGGRRIVAIYPRDFGTTSLYGSLNDKDWWVDGLEGASLVRTVLAPAATGQPWLLVGSTGGSIPCVPVVWTSADGSSWTEVRLPWSGSAVMVADRGAFAGGRYVVVGATGADHETWVSDDAVHWTELPLVGASSADYGPGLVAAGPAGFVGVSATGRESESDIWVLRADTQPGSTATPSPSPAAGWPTVTAGTAVLTAEVLHDAGPLTLRVTGRGLEPGARLTFAAQASYEISWICWRPRRSSDPSPYGPISDPYVDGGDTNGTATASATAIVGADSTVSVSIPLLETKPTCPADYPNLSSTDGRWFDARIEVSPLGIVLATDFLEEWLI